jgi:hypothetical protein
LPSLTTSKGQNRQTNFGARNCQVPLQLCFPFPKPKEPLKTEKKRVSFADLKAVACDPQPDLHNVDAAANDIFAVFCLQISWN